MPRGRRDVDCGRRYARLVVLEIVRFWSVVACTSPHKSTHGNPGSPEFGLILQCPDPWTWCRRAVSYVVSTSISCGIAHCVCVRVPMALMLAWSRDQREEGEALLTTPSPNAPDIPGSGNQLLQGSSLALRWP
jgi:hypothetical protein